MDPFVFHTVLMNDFSLSVKWMKMNKLVLNTTKSNTLYSIMCAFSQVPTHFIFHQRPRVEQVSEVKLLVIRLAHSMSWSDQINHIISMMTKSKAMAKKCAALANLYP